MRGLSPMGSDGALSRIGEKFADENLRIKHTKPGAEGPKGRRAEGVKGRRGEGPHANLICIGRIRRSI